jgi:hypothetical protein
MNVKNVKTLQAKAKAHEVAQINHNTFAVTSAISGKTYAVRLIDPCINGATCTCEWGKYRPNRDRRSGCSHVQAVYESLENFNNRTTATWNTMTDAKRQHRPLIHLGNGAILTSRKTA